MEVIIMSIWCAVILGVSLIIAALIVAVGIVLGGFFSSEAASTAFMPDEQWEDYQNRMTSMGKKYVSGMFGD